LCSGTKDQLKPESDFRRNSAFSVDDFVQSGNMLPKILADSVLLLHFAFVLFAVLGGIAVFSKQGVAWLHVPVVLWSSMVNFAGWTCPLTPLENLFRLRAGQAGYEGGFIQHYIEPLVYPGGMPRNFELIAGISILAWNGLVYLAALLYWRRRQP
jgi:hypothetical protein